MVQIALEGWACKSAKYSNMQISEVGGHMGQGIVGATLIQAWPTCMQLPLEKDLLFYKIFPPPPQLLTILYFMCISLILVWLRYCVLRFFPVSSREIKLFYHTSDSLLQGDWDPYI